MKVGEPKLLLSVCMTRAVVGQRSASLLVGRNGRCKKTVSCKIYSRTAIILGGEKVHMHIDSSGEVLRPFHSTIIDPQRIIDPPAV